MIVHIILYNIGEDAEHTLQTYVFTIVMCTFMNNMSVINIISIMMMVILIIIIIGLAIIMIITIITIISLIIIITSSSSSSSSMFITVQFVDVTFGPPPRATSR